MIDSIIVRISEKTGDYMEFRRLEDGTIFDKKDFRPVDTPYTLEEIAERARTPAIPWKRIRRRKRKRGTRHGMKRGKTSLIMSWVTASRGEIGNTGKPPCVTGAKARVGGIEYVSDNRKRC